MQTQNYLSDSKHDIFLAYVYISTALAEAEIEYNDSYQSTAVYVKYKLQQLSTALAALSELLIWIHLLSYK